MKPLKLEVNLPLLICRSDCFGHYGLEAQVADLKRVVRGVKSHLIEVGGEYIGAIIYHGKLKDPRNARALKAAKDYYKKFGSMYDSQWELSLSSMKKITRKLKKERK